MRKDAARNWDRIVEVGRRLVDEGEKIQLNDVARTAVVGVATVYRHFPTPEALLETIAAPGFEALLDHAERALENDDPWEALRDFLIAGIDAQARDPSLQPVFAAAESALPRTAELKERLAGVFGQLLERAQRAGAVNPEVTGDDLVPLMCGVVFAAKVHPDRTARHFLTVVLEGVRRRT